MYGIFAYIYPINDPNVGKHTIHGSSGYSPLITLFPLPLAPSPRPNDAEIHQPRDGVWPKEKWPGDPGILPELWKQRAQ